MNSEKQDLPAILGGEPAVTGDHGAAEKWPLLDRDDEEAVLRVMREGNISTHPVIRELEQDYREFTGRSYALAHSNGTAGLLAAFHAIGLKPGDEVLVPSATFWASVLPMIWLGALPVFCESEPDRLGIDPVDAERKITARTRAVVVVHLWGLPSRMTEILAMAKKHGLKIIEDASHCHGASWRGIPVGALGDISVFSLQGDKLAPGGEGGIFLTNEYDYFERAVCLGDITRIIELDTPAQRFAATSFGIKTRIAPLSAAVARSQLKRLATHNRKRNGNLMYLSHDLEELGIHTFLPPAHVERVYFEYIVRPDPKKIALPLDLLIKALQKEGCKAQLPRYPLLHQQPFFTEGHFRDIARLPDGASAPEYRPDALPETEKNSGTVMKLPSFPCAEKEILDQYIRAFRKVLSHQEEIISSAGEE